LLFFLYAVLCVSRVLFVFGSMSSRFESFFVFRYFHLVPLAIGEVQQRILYYNVFVCDIVTIFINNFFVAFVIVVAFVTYFSE